MYWISKILRLLNGCVVYEITIISILFLGYDLNTQELIGLALAIVGIVMVTMGETHDDPAPRRRRPIAPVKIEGAV